MSAPGSVTSGNTEEDWRVFEILTKDLDVSIILAVITEDLFLKEIAQLLPLL